MSKMLQAFRRDITTEFVNHATTHYEIGDALLHQAANDPSWDCGFADTSKCETLLNIKIILRSLALVFGVVTLVLLTLLRKYQSFRQRIFIYIIVLNLLNSTLKLLNNGYRNKICETQGYLIQVTGFSSFLWMCVITVYLAKLIIPGRVTQNIDRRERICLLVCFMVPLLEAALPLITGDYGPAGVYCGIVDTETGIIWRYTLWYGPVAIGGTVIFITFIVIYYHFVRMHRAWTAVTFDEEQTAIQRQYREQVNQTLGPFTVYAASFLILTLLQLVDRTDEVLEEERRLPLKIVHRIAGPCYDIAICLVFYVTNGCRQFSRRRFQESLTHHRQSIMSLIRRCRSDYDPYEDQPIILEGSVLVDPPSEVDNPGRTNSYPQEAEKRSSTYGTL